MAGRYGGLGLQLGYFASYVALFITGCVAAAPRWLEGWPEARVRLEWMASPTDATPLIPRSGGVSNKAVDTSPLSSDIQFGFATAAPN